MEGAEETEGQVRSNRIGLKAQCETSEEIYWNKTVALQLNIY